jgi:hypothetical protein
VIDKCRPITESGDNCAAVEDYLAQAQVCCVDLFRIMVAGNECATCALLKLFDGAVDLTTICMNTQVKTFAAVCKKIAL